jgi:hypothetical protein
MTEIPVILMGMPRTIFRAVRETIFSSGSGIALDNGRVAGHLGTHISTEEGREGEGLQIPTWTIGAHFILYPRKSGNSIGDMENLLRGLIPPEYAPAEMTTFSSMVGLNRDMRPGRLVFRERPLRVVGDLSQKKEGSSEVFDRRGADRRVVDEGAPKTTERRESERRVITRRGTDEDQAEYSKEIKDKDTMRQLRSVPSATESRLFTLNGGKVGFMEGAGPGQVKRDTTVDLYWNAVAARRGIVTAEEAEALGHGNI